VVAIAATNPMSVFDWQSEDFNVAEAVDFSQYAPQTAAPTPVDKADIDDAKGLYISMGTATGVYKLLNIPGLATATSQTMRLGDFLTSTGVNPGATLIFTGHSLAGALSPTLALWLKTNQMLETFKTLYVYPTAGASPGNGNFANLFNTTFPATTPGTTPAKQWNTLLWNQYDVVPHAWNTQPVSPNTASPSLANVAGLYAQGQPPLAELTCLINKAEAMSTGSGISYTPLRNQWLPGQLVTGQIHLGDALADVQVPPQYMTGELIQIGIQHISQYDQQGLMDIVDFSQLLKNTKVPFVPGIRQDNLGTVLKLALTWLGQRGCGSSPSVAA
jgi:hypothetical protein